MEKANYKKIHRSQNAAGEQVAGELQQRRHGRSGGEGPRHALAYSG
jgi:hypothetical protein